MTVLRYNTISTIPDTMEIVEYTFDTAEKSGAYCVDTSHFIPRSEAEAAFRRAGDSALQHLYDFPDGMDNGAKIPFARSADYHGDIAELSRETRIAQENANTVLDNAKIAFAREQALNSADSGSIGSTGSTE